MLTSPCEPVHVTESVAHRILQSQHGCCLQTDSRDFVDEDDAASSATPDPKRGGDGGGKK